MLWLAGLFSAISIKLCSSIDDVVWLAPFLTANSSMHFRMQNACIYTSICIVQTITAMIIAYCGDTAVKWLTADHKDAWSTEKILTVGAGTMLSLYSIKLMYEYIQECAEGDAEDEANGSRASRDKCEGAHENSVTTEDSDSPGDVELAKKPFRASSRQISRSEDRPGEIGYAYEDPSAKEKERQKTLLVIAYIGSVDDLTLFVPMLVGKGFDLVQLVCGAVAAASFIVSICLFIGQCKPVADCLSNIPLFAIVVVFAVVLLVRGFIMD